MATRPHPKIRYRWLGECFMSEGREVKVEAGKLTPGDITHYGTVKRLEFYKFDSRRYGPGTQYVRVHFTSGEAPQSWRAASEVHVHKKEEEE